MEAFKSLFAPAYRLVLSIARIFSDNRRRIRDLTSRPGIARALRLGMLATLLVWLIVALLTQEQQQDRLRQALEGLWPHTAEPDSDRRPRESARSE